MRAALTSGRARYCTPGVAGRFQIKEGMRNVFAHTSDRWERRLDVTLPPKKSVTSVLEKADIPDL
ncbi:hypothetical protein IVB18_23470 [Bradyrhizobium sp. 186]|uniref:hypothetical protein n=1 Tax=Bradyrhizobium sp. 186 TaxID=2782654 RepID=UPI00200113F1|nr:hypothetical protein [Bradyrhizobium sp. 186]UPK39924.1 hypothetical protein IVB18_23470 [Bradyrhizobium sp. 186]